MGALSIHISPGASVASTAETSNAHNVRLEKGAQIGDDVTIEGTAILKDAAKLSAGVRVAGVVFLGADSEVGVSTRIDGELRAGQRVEIGSNCAVFGNVNAQNDVSIGDSVVVTTCTSGPGPAHKRVPADDCEMTTNIGAGSYVGNGVVIKGGVEIGAGCFVEDYAVVSCDLLDDHHLAVTGRTSLIPAEGVPGVVPLSEVQPDISSLVPREVSEFGIDLDSPGVSQGRCRLPDKGILNYLYLNQGSETLFVVFHGAIDRNKYRLPRFEWFNTMRRAGVNSLFVADPALLSHPELRLGWYLGTLEFDFLQYLAGKVSEIVRATQAKRVVFFGFSGGGFAALRISAMLPDSVALVIDPDTTVPALNADGSMQWPFFSFLRNVMPSLAPDKVVASHIDPQWDAPIRERLSVLEQYNAPVPNHVLYLTNQNDSFHSKHFLPFAESQHQDNDFRVVQYEGPFAHTLPPKSMIESAIQLAVDFTERLCQG